MDMKAVALRRTVINIYRERENGPERTRWRKREGNGRSGIGSTVLVHRLPAASLG